MKTCRVHPYRQVMMSQSIIQGVNSESSSFTISLFIIFCNFSGGTVSAFFTHFIRIPSGPGASPVLSRLFDLCQCDFISSINIMISDLISSCLWKQFLSDFVLRSTLRVTAGALFSPFLTVSLHICFQHAPMFALCPFYNPLKNFATWFFHFFHIPSPFYYYFWLLVSIVGYIFLFVL